MAFPTFVDYTFSVCIRILFIYLSKTFDWSLNDIFSDVRHKYVCNLLGTNCNELIVHLDVCEQQNKWGFFFLFFSLKQFSKFSMRSRLSLISMQIIIWIRCDFCCSRRHFQIKLFGFCILIGNFFERKLNRLW